MEGQLCDNSSNLYSVTPLQTELLIGVRQLESGAGHSCSLVTSSQKVYCWGANYADTTALTWGMRHSCYLSSEGTVHC